MYSGIYYIPNFRLLRIGCYVILAMYFNKYYGDEKKNNNIYATFLFIMIKYTFYNRKPIHVFIFQY